MYKVKVNNDPILEVLFKDDACQTGKINDMDFKWDYQLVKNACGCYHIIKDNLSFNTSVLEFDEEKKAFIISVRGNVYHVSVRDEYDELLDNLGFTLADTKKTNEIKASMPGLVKEIFVKAGDELVKGQSILILEAMKMENVIKVMADATVKSIEVKVGQAVDKNQLLMKFK